VTVHDNDAVPEVQHEKESDNGKPGFHHSDLRSGHGILNEPSQQLSPERRKVEPVRLSEQTNSQRSTESGESNSEAIIAQSLAQFLEFTTEQSWTGPLPSPEDFVKYPREVQEKVVEWNDVRILDESRRADSLVQAEISHSKTVTGWGVMLTLFFTTLAGIAGIGQNNLGLAALFLGVPALSIVTTFIQSSIFSKPQKRQS
jgi:hypothetical protein